MKRAPVRTSPFSVHPARSISSSPANVYYYLLVYVHEERGQGWGMFNDGAGDDDGFVVSLGFLLSGNFYE